MKTLRLSTLVVLLPLVGGVAAAQTPATSIVPQAQPQSAAARRAESGAPEHLGVAFKVSTLGIGIEAARPVSRKLNVRGGVNFLNLDLSSLVDSDDDGLTLVPTVRLQSIDTHLDWFPFGGGFHISPGVMLHNGNEVRGLITAKPGTKFELGDDSNLVSNPANPVTGRVLIAWKHVAPSLTLGWGNLVPHGARHWSIPFEFGLVYTKAATGTFTLTGSACQANGANCKDVASDAALQNDLRTEEKDLNDSLSEIPFHPVISIGFSYKF